MVEIIVKLPDEIANQLGLERSEIPRRILEAIALEGYRSARLSREQVARLLQIGLPQTDQFLAHHNAAIGSTLNGTDSNLEAFRRILPELLRTDRGRFVAISDGAIFDRDPDEFALVERISNRSSGRPVLIQRVMEPELEEVHIDTPEFGS